MTEFWDMLKLALPALLCILTAVLVFTGMQRRQLIEARQEMRLKAFSTVMPLRIGAYERAVLFLHRIQPDNLMLRVDPNNKSAKMFKQQLLDEIRSEYDHNAVQQLYISDAAWSRLLFARDQTASLIQGADEGLGDRATGLDFAKKVLAEQNQRTEKPVDEAIQTLKKDIAKLFG